MTEEQLRERLASALTDGVIVPVERGPVLDALLPIVRAYADQRAAEALREAVGSYLLAWGDSRQVPIWVLRDAADALAPTDTPEAHHG